MEAIVERRRTNDFLTTITAHWSSWDLTREEKVNSALVYSMIKINNLPNFSSFDLMSFLDKHALKAIIFKEDSLRDCLPNKPPPIALFYYKY
jgi:hypothetical protein